MDIPLVDLDSSTEINQADLQNLNQPNDDQKLRAELLELKKAFKKVVGTLCKTLPPWAEESRLKDGILKDENVKAALGGEEVLSITKDEDNKSYIVKSENHQIEVKIKYFPMDLIGPLPFEVVIVKNQ